MDDELSLTNKPTDRVYRVQRPACGAKKKTPCRDLRVRAELARREQS